MEFSAVCYPVYIQVCVPDDEAAIPNLNFYKNLSF